LGPVAAPLLFGGSMSSATPFLLKSSVKTIAASTAHAEATFAETERSGDDLYVFNSTAGIAFVKWGLSTATVNAAPTDFPIPAGVARVVKVGNIDQVSVILSTGTGNVYVAKGEGV